MSLCAPAAPCIVTQHATAAVSACKMLPSSRAAHRSESGSINSHTAVLAMHNATHLGIPSSIKFLLRKLVSDSAPIALLLVTGNIHIMSSQLNIVQPHKIFARIVLAQYSWRPVSAGWPFTRSTVPLAGWGTDSTLMTSNCTAHSAQSSLHVLRQSSGMNKQAQLKSCD